VEYLKLFHCFFEGHFKLTGSSFGNTSFLGGNYLVWVYFS